MRFVEDHGSIFKKELILVDDEWVVDSTRYDSFDDCPNMRTSGYHRAGCGDLSETVIKRRILKSKNRAVHFLNYEFLGGFVETDRTVMRFCGKVGYMNQRSWTFFEVHGYYNRL